MSQRLCPRCRHAVQFEDDSTLVFCGNCGAPQITVSAEILEKSAQAASSLGPNSEHVETEEARTARIEAQPPDHLIQWKSALRIAATVCGIISLICIAFPLELLAWLAPGVVMFLYSRRHSQTRITTDMGARIGLLCGIFSAFGITVTTTVQMLAMRFGLHEGAILDNLFTQQLVQGRVRTVAQSGEATAAAIFNSPINIPQFRAGFYLAAALFCCVLLIGLSTLSGAFSGYMRSRRMAPLSRN